MLLLRILQVIVLAILAQYVNGNQRIVHVSTLSSDISSNTTCCVYGNCSCGSLDHALANLASYVLINITTDVMLSSLVKSSKLKRVSIVGYNNPTVKCDNGGGIHFTSCYTCIIHNIVWDGCGNKSKPAIKFGKSSNILISNCTFQYSKGQAVVLSGMREGVNILHCNFMHNRHYKRHGAAIYYLSTTITLPTISYCNFMYNKGAKNLVYIESKLSKYRIILLTLNNSKFCHNQGLLIYAINSIIYLDGKNSFLYNTANETGGIYITNHSSITFNENSESSFIQNSAYLQGGIVVLKHNSDMVFDHNSMAKFYDNTGVDGIIYSQTTSIIVFKANCEVTFAGNSAKQYNSKGGAIFSYDFSIIYFDDNASTVFINNVANLYGGAIYCQSGVISLRDNASTVFINNTARQGGAIYLNNALILLEGNSSTVFSKNTADWRGGAMYFNDNSHISFEGNSSTVFSSNVAGFVAGAMFSLYTNIFFKGNCFTLFDNNTAALSGGAMKCDNQSYLLLEENASAVFNNNRATIGGAITLEHSFIQFNGNSFTMFTNNSANSAGGAVYFEHCLISFTANSTTEFSNNVGNLEGGGVYAQHSNVSFEGLSVTDFSNNTANKGGALFAASLSNVYFLDTSTVKFMDNKGTLDAIVLSVAQSNVTATENFTVIFNDQLPKWCNNKCLPYSDAAIKIQSDGIVWCNDQKTFKCLSKKCECKKLEDLLSVSGLENNSVVNITTDVTLSSVIELHFLTNISVIGHNNITVSCFDDGGLDMQHCSELKIEGISWLGCGSYFYHPVINIKSPGPGIIIQNCTFQYSMGEVILMFSIECDVSFNNCNFMNNNNGVVILGILWNHPGVKTNLVFTININNCNFSYNGNALLDDEAFLQFHVLFENLDFVTHMHLRDSKFHNNHGVSVYLPSKNYILHISGEVMFSNNVAKDGAGIYIGEENSYVIFHENSITKFINNTVNQNGAAMFLIHRSSVIFEQNSYVAFNDNKAINGTIYSKDNCNVIFKTNCQVIFDGNLATRYGSAVYSSDHSHVTFTGNSSVEFSYNTVGPSTDTDLRLGGTLFSENNGYVLFEENSLVVFSNNSADFGAAILSLDNSSIVFRDQSEVIFTNNVAQSCGALTVTLSSTVNFTDNVTVAFDTNTASFTLNSSLAISAGAMCTFQAASITFSGYSLITFTNSKAYKGGATAFSESNVILQDYSCITFEDNIAQYSSGGALTCTKNNNVTVKGNSNVTFNSNSADQSGGAIHAYGMCKITFKDNSTSNIINNTARDNGGAIFSSQTSEVNIEGNSNVFFANNTANYGGTLYFANSTLIFNETSTHLFYNNIARRSGGVGYISLGSIMMIKGSTTVEFKNNMAEQNAGALYCKMSNISFMGNSNTTLSSNRADNGGAILAYDHCNITLTENSVLLFTGNEAAQSGGAGYFNYQCNLNMEENTMLAFANNRALFGGAVCIGYKTETRFTGNSTAFFYNNLAIKNGGAVKVLNDSSIILKDHTTIRFSNSIANYGGAVFLDKTSVMINGSDKSCLKFTNNLAKILGDSLYQDVHELCDNNCLTNRINGISNELVATPPNELKFYDPAICIDDDNDTQCNSYYVQDIILGREIIIPACVLDHYNHSVESTHFLVQSEAHCNFFISGPEHALISCDAFKGISIMGNKSLSKSTNFSITVTLNTRLYSDWKEILVNLTIGLSPCHPGFWQYSKSEKCECYNANDIVFCSNGISTIKRGYWFGSVTGKPTTTLCPINYCNFTCCENSNGYYHLSPVRKDQCRSHRSGTACGSCIDGYTLSFDSTECVNSCTAGETALVILLTVAYWIVMIALIFGMIYYRVGIGYLYSITYYYSIVDILLSQNLKASRGLYLTETILSSFFKTTPLFLGEFCLTAGMSGIDQQFIHYIHPAAVISILVIIHLVARRFQRISAIITWGKFRVICFLLLLSYSSITSTSLLLMRSLTFHQIDKVYTYLSPDIEYFHGRHLAYGIVALLCIVIIVIGLPLLLVAEPFLKHKINFLRIKPVLDQFQGCYKEKYHCFAGYYMICRLLLITIVIVNTTNHFIANYMIIVICGVTDFIHLTVKPYSKENLNRFDAFILHMIIFIAALPFFEDFDSTLIISTTFALVIVPLLIFIGLTLLLHEDHFRKLATYLTSRDESPSNDDLNTNEAPTKEFGLVIDDSMRKNATIFDM